MIGDRALVVAGMGGAQAETRDAGSAGGSEHGNQAATGKLHVHPNIPPAIIAATWIFVWRQSIFFRRIALIFGAP